MEADAFLLFYIKRRIEQDGDLTWHEAPYCCEEGHEPAHWLAVEEAALRFEHDNRAEIQARMIGRLAECGKAANFRTFKKIVDVYFELLQHRLDQGGESPQIPSILCVPILALVAFTGLYARKLAEADAELGDRNRDFRRELYQVSIYGSAVLSEKLRLFQYSWDHFCGETRILLERIASQYPQSASSRLFIGVPIAICGLAAAAYFFIRRTAITT